MSRPTDKPTLLAAANGEFEKLWKLIDAMPDTVRRAAFAFDDRDKNLRDVLVHLYEWHQLLLDWVRANRAGETASFLPAPYTWKTYPQMNVAFWEKHQDTPLDKAKTMLTQSHAEVMALIEPFTSDELFVKKHFPWTGTTSLGSYCVSATSSHYDWAVKKLKQHVKTAQ